MQRLDRRTIPEGAEGPLAFLIEAGQDERLPGHLVATIARARSQPGLARAQADALRRHGARRCEPVTVTARL
jgi:hypothetical protein